MLIFCIFTIIYSRIYTSTFTSEERETFFEALINAMKKMVLDFMGILEVPLLCILQP